MCATNLDQVIASFRTEASRRPSTWPAVRMLPACCSSAPVHLSRNDDAVDRCETMNTYRTLDGSMRVPARALPVKILPTTMRAVQA